MTAIVHGVQGLPKPYGTIFDQKQLFKFYVNRIQVIHYFPRNCLDFQYYLHSKSCKQLFWLLQFVGGAEKW